MLVKHRFGHLASFASDVEVFLEVLTPEKKSSFLEKIMESSESLSTMPTKVLGKAIILFKVQEVIGTMYKLPNSGRSLAI